MACLYLVRHAMAEPAGSVCAGCRTDGPLTAEGQAQARAARAWVQGMRPAPVYASPLRRSRETARLLAGPDGEIRVRRALRELDMGEWDGKRFADIRAQYPELYAARGENQALMPPGAESFPAAAARMSRTLAAIAAPLDEQEERVVVSHSGAIRAFLCRITGLPYRQNRRLALPYGGICAVEYGPAGWRCLQAGVPASQLPDPPAIEALWRACGAGEPARLHGETVARVAVRICRRLAAAGLVLDEDLVRTAALLHDLCRHQPHHPQAAARLLRRSGYFRLAAVVALHEEGDDWPEPNEEGLVFLADKLVQECEETTILARFAKSRDKCRTPEALAAHERRLNRALRLEQICRARTGGAL